MAEMYTVELSEKVVYRAREVADRTQRRVEDVLAEWMEHFVDDMPVEMLVDDHVLQIATMQLPEDQQSELSDLLSKNREGELDDAGHKRLDELMAVYRLGLVRKAKAIKVAVERGLISPVSEWPDNHIPLPDALNVRRAWV